MPIPAEIAIAILWGLSFEDVFDIDDLYIYSDNYDYNITFGGAWGIQTPDLGNANAALYQLS